MDQPTASTATAPENSRTIALQIDQLASGLRRVVMLPRGTPLVKRRKGLDAYQDEFGNTYYFQPSAISSLDIARAVSENRLPEILGPTDGGLGTKDKSQLGPDAVAVVAWDEDGTEVHAAAVDPEGIHHAEEQAAKVVPPGGDVSVEPVEDTIAKRQESGTDAPKHDYSSTQVNIPEPLASRVRQAGKDLPPEDLGDEGLEDEVHVTIKFGLHTNSPSDVETALQGERGPITLRLGKTSLFSNEDADVLKLDVESPDLHRLNRLLSKSLEATDTHPKYVPHVTLAYLKPGSGKQYEGFDIPGITGQVVTVPSIVFSGKDGNKVDIPLPPTVTVKAPRAPLALKSRVKKPKPARSMAEIRAQQLIPYSSSKHSAMAGIQRLIQQQRFQDALKAAQRASAAGRLSHDEIEHAVDRGLDTPLVADAKRLDLEKLVSILPLASPEERKKILPALGDKLDSELRNMMPVERKSILAALVKLRMLKPEDAVT